MTVDTLSLAKELRASELPAAQAEAIAAAIGRAVIETAATKADLLQVKTELEAKIEALKSEMIRWMVGTQVATAAVIIAAFKL